MKNFNCLLSILLLVLIQQQLSAQILGKLFKKPEFKRSDYESVFAPFPNKENWVFTGMNSSFTFSASMPQIISYDSPNQLVYSETLDLLTSSKANYTFLPTAELGYRRIRHNNDKGLVFGFLLTKNRFSAKSQITDNTSGERVELHMNGEDWRVLFQIGGVFIRDKWRYSFHSNMGFGAGKDYNLEVRLYDPQGDLISKDGEGLKSSFYSADLTFGLGGFAAYSLNDHLETSLHYNIYWVNVSRKEVNSLSQAIFRWHGFLNNAISLQLAYAF